jgi:hypothetical protein
LVAEHCFSEFVKLGHRVGDREPRDVARSKKPVSAPRMPPSALRSRQQLRLLGGNDAFTKVAVALVLNRWNKANAGRPLVPMKRRQPRFVIARRKAIIDARSRSESFKRLSGGTQEQIAVLVRLAMGTLLAERGGNVPILLDDALVYCDDDRINLMFDALSRAGKHQQIIVLTCRLRSFAPLGGHTLRVQMDGLCQ